MLRLAKLGRLFLTLLIALAFSMPTFARAMPMPVGPDCGGHHCTHQSSRTTHHGLPACATAACMPVVASMPEQPIASNLSFYSVEHLPAPRAARAGLKAMPEPYPPRSFT